MPVLLDCNSSRAEAQDMGVLDWQYVMTTRSWLRLTSGDEGG